MTAVNVAIGPNPVAAARTGERGGKDEPAGSKGSFDEALTAKSPTSTKRAQHVQSGDRATQSGDRIATSLRELIHSIAAEDLQAADPQPDNGDALLEEPIDIPAVHVPEQDALDASATEETSTEADAPGDGLLPVPASPALPAAPAPAPGLHIREEMPAQPASGVVAPDREATPSPAVRVAAGAPASGASAVLAASGGGTTTEAPVELAGKPAPQVAQSADAAQQRGQSAAPDGTRLVTPPAGDRNGEAAQPRITVLGFNTSAAPAQPGPTSAGLIAAIEAEPTWRAVAEAAASVGQRGPAHHHNVSTLRIQLNPAELGMVTARLVATGQQLEIEIKVESSDARQRLANDSEAIVKALRAVGFDVERVTIQHTPQGSNTTAQQGGQGRDASTQEQGRQQADADAGGRNGQNGAGDDKPAHRTAGGAAAQERTGGGVYI